MHVIARMAREPAPHFGYFVRPVIIHDHVHLGIGRKLRIDEREELEKFLMPMSAMAPC